MTKIFLDTNILLDWILDRKGATEVGRLFERADSPDDELRLYASFLSVANIAYVLRKKPDEVILKTIKSIVHYVNILDMTQMQLRGLNDCASPDMEDRMQILCAESGGVSCILTGNEKHLRGYTDIPVMTYNDLFCNN